MNACPQERGHKHLGTAARLRHLAYIVAVVALGIWWTSASAVSDLMLPRDDWASRVGGGETSPSEMGSDMSKGRNLDNMGPRASQKIAYQKSILVSPCA